MSSRVHGANTGSVPLNVIVVRKTPMVVPTYTVSRWPGSTTTASVDAVVFLRSPVRNHFDDPSYHQSWSESSADGSPCMARNTDPVVPRAGSWAAMSLHESSGDTSVDDAGWSTSSSVIFVTGVCHTPAPLRLKLVQRPVEQHPEPVRVGEAEHPDRSSARPEHPSCASLTAPARGSVLVGRVNEIVPQSSVYQTRLLPTASWFFAPFAIVWVE